LSNARSIPVPDPRYYYDKKIIYKVISKRLTYRFGVDVDKFLSDSRFAAGLGQGK
jgi:hypothetical protein